MMMIRRAMLYGRSNFLVLLLLSLDFLTTSYGWTFVDRLGGRVYPKTSSSLRRFGTPENKGAPTSTKKDMESMLDFIQQPMDSMVADKSKTGSTIIDPEDMEFVTTVVQAADGRKAEDIKVLFVGDVSTLTSFLVILSGNSRPQNQAIAAAVKNDVEEQYNLRPGGNGVPEGTAESGWMLLDYGSVMVHVMTPKSRLFYNVEGQWKDKGGKEIDVSHVLVPNSAIMDNDNTRMDDGFVAEEEDPFWS